MYVGIAKDVPHRLLQHNAGQTRSTRGRRPFRLIYTEEYATRPLARVREKYLKTGTGREYVKTLPGWRNRQTQQT